MKKIGQVTLVALFSLCLITFASCGGPAPRENAEKAVNYLIQGDTKAFYNLLSDTDKEAITVENFEELYSVPSHLETIKEIYPEGLGDAFRAKDFKETITGETAVVTYVLILPDIDQIGRGIFSLQDLMALSSAGKMKSLADLPEETKAKLKEYADKNELPTKETVQQINMIREHEEWRVDLNVNDLIKSGDGIRVFQDK